MTKLVSRVFLSAIVVSMLSCDRTKKSAHGPDALPDVTSSDSEPEPNSGDGKFGKFNIDISDERYLNDVKILVTGVAGQLAAQIISPSALAKVTSKSWNSSSRYAVLGEVKSEKELKLLQNSIGCHFVDLRSDYARSKSQTDFNIVQYELIRISGETILHLSNDKDKSSKYISCLVPEGQVLTGFDLQKAFGNSLGLVIYLK